jgi:hypothetical protein
MWGNGPPGLKGYTGVHMRFASKVVIVVASLLSMGMPAGAACKVDSECILVPADCCGCTGGGKQKAILQKGKASYERARQSRCADTLCASVMSQDASCSAIAVCKEGKCTLKP